VSPTHQHLFEFNYYFIMIKYDNTLDKKGKITKKNLKIH
jgi:hypothetical protein